MVAFVSLVTSALDSDPDYFSARDAAAVGAFTWIAVACRAARARIDQQQT